MTLLSILEELHFLSWRKLNFFLGFSKPKGQAGEQGA